MSVCIKDLGQSSTSIAWVSVLEKMSYSSTRYFISSKKHTRKNFILGSGLKASNSKSIKTKVAFILREPQSSSHKLMDPGGKRNDNRTRWPSWILIPGRSLSYISTMLESRPVSHVSSESEVWIFVYHLLILTLATKIFPQKTKQTNKQKKNSGNEISTMMCWNQPSVSASFYF